ncbi:MAG: ribosome small subunit-dependent GTPase A [Acidimicrobiales bacterium]
MGNTDAQGPSGPGGAGLLRALGWDNQWNEVLHALKLPGVRPARIVRVDRGECDVVSARGRERVISDSTRAQGATAPVTGDWIAVVDDAADSAARIAAVLSRRHTLTRRDPGERVAEQVMVANVDSVAIVHGLDRRLPPGRLERLLIMAWDSGAEPIIVLTKSDLDDLYEARGIARALGGATAVVDVSRVDGRGVFELRRRIPIGSTAALVGESGAGKSNLLNLLVGEAVQATGRVRQRDAKGRHTTVAREIHVIPRGGAVIDTPGIRAVGLMASEDTLHRVFADIDDLARECRFANCGHGSEPQCAVQQAVADGTLDPRRLLRYRALAAEIAEQPTERHKRPRR